MLRVNQGRRLMMVKKGDRVGAIQSSDKDIVKFFGYGVYVGDTIPPNFPILNPTINLDNGQVVYGYECWWGSEARVKEIIGDRKVIEVLPDRR
jgi:hypothetical protein